MKRIPLRDLWQAPLPMRDLDRLFHSWRMLESAGIPPVRIFTVLAREGASLRVRRCCARLSDHVERGATLHQALQWERNAFPIHLPGMIQIAERTGTMHDLIERLSAFYTDMRCLQYAVIKQCSYPLAVLLAISTGIPLLRYFLTSTAQSTSLETHAVVRIVLQGLTPFAVAWLLFWLFRHLRPLHHVLQFLLALPGPLGFFTLPFRRMRLAWALHFCAHTGLTWPAALRFAAEQAADPLQRRALKGTPEMLNAGIPLAQVLHKTRLFDRFQLEAIDVGEETGTLDEAFRRIAAHCREIGLYRVRNAIVLIETVFIAGLGMLIALGLV
ncbi:MAG: type II secretion system F family protein [Candidatus Hydrogenedentes bacterium]|nr:type II secretion system F family protein [Candidatus Hydrogenedentota bacterium]